MAHIKNTYKGVFLLRVIIISEMNKLYSGLVFLKKFHNNLKSNTESLLEM